MRKLISIALALMLIALPAEAAYHGAPIPASAGGTGATSLAGAGLPLLSTAGNTFTQTVNTSGSQALTKWSAAAHTTLDTGVEMSDLDADLSATAQFTAGAITNLRSVRIRPRTYGFTSASTVTAASSFPVDGAPTAGTNATITKNYIATFGIPTTTTDAQSTAQVGFFGAGTVKLALRDSTDATELNISCGSTPLIRTRTASALGLGTNGTTRMTIASGGGISTTADLTVGTTLANTGNYTCTSGDVIIATAGKGIQLTSGSNARAGTATLVAGTVTVSNTSVGANTKVRYWEATAGGVQGILSYTKINATSFTLNSSSAADTSTVDWELVEVN